MWNIFLWSFLSHSKKTPNAGDKWQSVRASEVRRKKKQGEKKNCEEDRRGIDLFLTANQFNNSVNGEAQWVWGKVNGTGWRWWWWWWGGLKSQVDTLPYFVCAHRMPLTILLSVPGFSQNSSHFSQGRMIFFFFFFPLPRKCNFSALRMRRCSRDSGSCC